MHEHPQANRPIACVLAPVLRCTWRHTLSAEATLIDWYTAPILCRPLVWRRYPARIQWPAGRGANMRGHVR